MCGFCVDPGNPQELAKAMNSLLNNDAKALSFGKNGRYAVEKKYNWNLEEKKLISHYNFVSKKK